MSRRQINKAAKLASWLSRTASPPKSDGLEVRLGQAVARMTRKRSLRDSLLMGTALSAGVLAASVGATLIDVRPAMAVCNVIVPEGTTQTCGPGTYSHLIFDPAGGSGTFTEVVAAPSTIGPYAGTGITFDGNHDNQTLSLTVAGPGTTITTTGTGPGHDGVYMNSTYTDTTLNFSNAAALNVGNSGIHLSIHDGNETSNDHISIYNSGNISAGHNGITAILIAHVNPTDVNAVNTITISNTGAIGNATNYVGHDGIFSLLTKDSCTDCGTGSNIITSSRTGNNTVTTSAPIFSNGSAVHVITGKITDIPHGDATAVANTYNSFALHSKFANGIHNVAESESYQGIALSEISITNSGPINAHGNGIVGNASASGTGGKYSAVQPTLTGGNATATTDISNVGNITGSGNATTTALGARRGIYGIAGAVANSNTISSLFTTGNPVSGTGGTAKANVSVYNSGTIKSRFAGIKGNATAIANGYAFQGNTSVGGNATDAKNAVAQGGTAIANVTISNVAAGTITTGNTSGQGIEGQSTAIANAGATSQVKYGTDRPATALGGNATAFTSISNAANVASFHQAVDGSAYASAQAFASYSGNISYNGGNGTGKAGSATGGVSTAVVVISNTGNKSTDGNASGAAVVYGASAANSSASGYHALGGAATAITAINNSQSLTGDWGIYGNASALANANGNTSDTHSTAIGGTSSADVGITNIGNITAVGHRGINGFAYADSSASAYTAEGGAALAGTEITNSGNITSHYKGIYGGAVAKASAFGGSSGNATAAKYGTGIGGTANAGVSISNMGSVSNTGKGTGIEGSTFAGAYGDGYIGKGGTATAGTVVTNSGNLTTFNTALSGNATAEAGGYGSGSGNHSTGTGGTATAVVFITNGGNITTTGHGDGIRGNATADAYARGFTATGGTSTADVLITNVGNMTTASRGISGYAKAGSPAFGNSATGGSAVAGTEITNNGNITSTYKGIYGGAVAKAGGYGNKSGNATAVGTGGIARAGVSISNTGAISNSGFGHGIDGYSKAKAIGTGFTAKGGTATAGTVVSNFGALTTYHTAIYGGAVAQAGGYGNKTAKGASGTGGTAAAAVFITNNGGLTTTATHHHDDADGIIGYSKANAIGTGYTATGGTATAITTISNSGTIYKTQGAGIYGGAIAKAGGYGNTSAKGGKGTGGTASALVLINNTASIYNVHGSSIQGYAKASAKGKGFTAQGGTAAATTELTNSGGTTLTSVHYTAIHGEAFADASGIAPVGTKGSKGTGGTANAGVDITNFGNIQAGGGHGTYASGIVGYSQAKAVGVGYTGIGGTVNAAALITNTGAIFTDFGSGIYGTAEADASGIGNKSDPKGVGTGGNADALTFITNTGNLTTTESSSNYGISGYSKAKAVGVGWTATGGNATAFTNITNTGKFIEGFGTGIYGGAVAEAGAYSGGSTSASCVEPCEATGGFAVAQTVIVNSASMYSIDDYGISGFSKAKADATAVSATGGTAIAGTYITNTGNISGPGNFSEGPTGIKGVAIAAASAHGSYGLGGEAKGGTAVAKVFITNSGNIYAGDGIVGFAGAFANGEGRYGVGGTATAVSTISNSGLIEAYSSPGISNGAVAKANGYITGGTAIAIATITNSANMKTYSDGAAGIYAFTKAEASGGSDRSVGGTATANTDVSNAGQIQTFDENSPGIEAKSSAEAFGHSGGTAIANTLVTNVNDIVTDFNYGSGNSSGSSDGSPGIDAKSFAGASGTATAATVVSNAVTGTIITFGPRSDGIHASSFAEADAAPNITASATTLVSNAANITTLEWKSDGIDAFAGAKGYGLSILGVSAYTLVDNSGSILIEEGHSYGIRAKTLAIGDATAVTVVNNSGNVTTLDHDSPAISASSYAGGGVFSGNATAKTYVNNSAVLITKGKESAGILAYAGAGQVSGTATAKIDVSNSGSVITYGHHSDGISSYVKVGSTGAANATIGIENSGLVVTYGHHSTAIYAGVASLGSPVTAAIGIYNSGTVIAAGGWHQFGYHAIVTYGAPSFVLNSGTGTIDGNLQLAFGKKNTFVNEGLWRMRGDSSFGGNVNSAVDNSGKVVRVGPGAIQLSPDLATPQVLDNVTTLFGLENFNNTGTVSFGDGSTNQRIVLSNYDGKKVFFNGGPGSTLLVNASLGGPPVAVTHTYTVTAGYTTGSSTTITTGNFSVGAALFSISGTQTFGNGSVTFTGTFGNLSGNLSSTSTTSTSGTSLTVTGNVTKTTYVVSSQADVLQVGGLSKGNLGKGYVTGTTTIVVNDTAPNLPGSYNPVGIPVVESSGAVLSGSGTNVASNFALANGPIQKGFFQYNLLYVPGTQESACAPGFNCWFLASTPGTAAQEFTQLGQAADDIWSDAAGLWLDRTADLRDYFFNAQSTCDARGGGADLAVKAPPCIPTPSGVGPGAWVRAYGDWIHSTENATWNAFGTTITSPVHYDQTIGGAQIGYDWAFMRTGYSTILVGLLGGANESTVNFASGTKVNFQGGNAGAYATFLNRGFFADGLFLANWMSMDYTSAGSLFGLGGPTVANVAANSDLAQYGGRIDSGYRFQFNPWFFEPELTAEVVHTSFGNLPFPIVATNVQLDDDFSVRGRLGGRIGTTWVTSGWRIEPSIDGGVWETFAGNNGAVLTNNGFNLDLSDPNNNKTLGEIGGMLNFYQIGTNWSAFVKGDYRFADQYTSGSVKGGMRYQWP